MIGKEGKTIKYIRNQVNIYLILNINYIIQCSIIIKYNLICINIKYNLIFFSLVLEY